MDNFTFCRKISISWSSSYNSFVKFHGKIWEPQHDPFILKLSVIMMFVVKELHCSTNQNVWLITDSVDICMLL